MTDLLYVECTMLVTGDFMPRAEPVIVNPAQMMADMVALAGIDRENATEAQLVKMAEVDRRMNPPVIDKHDVKGRARREAEWLAKSLGLAPVATAARTTYDEPIPCLARGYAWGGSDPYDRAGFAQGCVLATWEPLTYPANGDWTWGPNIWDQLRFFDTDIAPRETPEPVTINDPLADLRVWAGVAAEIAFLEKYGIGPRSHDPLVRAQAIQMLQGRRDHQADGKPLWEADVRPGPMRKGEWTMFACRATDTHLIPPENLTALAGKDSQPK